MLTKKTAVLAKIETGYGVDASPAVTDGLLVSDLDFKPKGETLQRDFYRSSLSKQAHVMGIMESEISFTTEIKGSGTAGVAPMIGKLFQACAMREDVNASDVVYTPVSDEDDMESLTIYFYRDGILHKILGARGTFSIDLKAGQYGKIKWTFKGLYQEAADTALVTPVIAETTLPPVIFDADFSWGSYAAIAKALTIDLANELVRRDSFNAEKGVELFRITDRNPKGSFQPDAVVEATQPFWGDWEDGTERALEITIGATAGNICTIAAPQCQPDDLAYADENGVASYDLKFALRENGSPGDNELSITFS